MKVCAPVPVVPVLASGQRVEAAPSKTDEINAREILCERGGRRRTGSLTLRKRAGKMTWCAQVTVDTDDGATKRVLYSLDTDDRTIAKRKLRKLVSRLDNEREVRRDDAGAAETVADYFAAWLERRRADGYDVRDDECAIRKWALGELGWMMLHEVKASHLRAVLSAVANAGRSRHSVKRVRGALYRLFKSAWCDEVINENPMSRVEIPSARIFASVPQETHAPATACHVNEYVGAGDVPALTVGGGQ